MATSQSTAVIAMFALGLAFAPAASADSAGDACKALSEARVALDYMQSMPRPRQRRMSSMRRCKRQAPSLISCLPA